jgi:hypothetical protein
MRTPYCPSPGKKSIALPVSGLVCLESAPVGNLARSRRCLPQYYRRTNATASGPSGPVRKMLGRADGSLMAQRVPFNGTFTIDVYLMGRVQSRGARQNRGMGQVPCRAALELERDRPLA